MTSITALCHTADPQQVGARIKAARLRAGISQSELADGLASPAFLSRIEGGKRRVGADLLTALAARLGVDALDLLTDAAEERGRRIDLELDHAELALRTGSLEPALTTTKRLLEDGPHSLTPQQRRSARRLHAMALEATGAITAAIAMLEGLAHDGPHDLDWLGDMIRLSRCYRTSGELDRSIAVGEAVEKELAASDLTATPEHVQLVLTVAASHFERGETARASEMCEAALETANRLGSPAAIASAYWNASIIRSRSGDGAAALQLAERALRVLEQGEDARNIARLRTQVGVLRLRAAPPDVVGALTALTEADRDLALSDASVVDKAHNDLALARAHYLVGALDDARRYLDRADGAAVDQAPLSSASAAMLRGALEFAAGDADSARERFTLAATTLAGYGAHRAVGELWFDLAAHLEAIGETEQALVAYRSAAASAGIGTPGGSARAVAGHTAPPA